MKTIEELSNDTRIISIEKYDNGVMGYLRLRTEKQRTFSFVADWNKDGWEHVSISIFNDGRKMPTWAEMCEVKEIFWCEDEEVHQIHPKASNYFHGIGDLQNVLHLWRPIHGWKD